MTQPNSLNSYTPEPLNHTLRSPRVRWIAILQRKSLTIDSTADVEGGSKSRNSLELSALILNPKP